MCTVTHRRWNDEELKGVLALYCQLPFGKMHARNRAVTALAKKIGRSPSAVALKLVNFASLDPDLKSRGIAGMRNVSEADRHIWSQYYGRWDELSDASLVDVIDELQHDPTVHRPTPQPPSGPTEVMRHAKSRRGQSFFRATVIAAYDWRCCITGIAAIELLRASHIVPWSEDPSLRLDPHNGLCLNALHDAAFDRGLITFNDDFRMCVARGLKDEIPRLVYGEMFERYSDAPITMPERFKPDIRVLRRQRKYVFRA
jgi:hypothetical protein